MHTIRRRTPIVFVLTLLVTLLTGCHGSDDDDPAAAAETLERALAPREVRLIQPETREERPSVQLVGEIRAFDTVVVSSEVAGKADRVLAEVGDRVEEGAALAWVDRDTFRIYLRQAEANLAAADADLALAGKELERKRDLRSDETISQSVFDQAKANFDLAKARMAAAAAALDLAARNYDRSVIRAPAAGAITQRLVVAGQWAEVGEGIFHLAVGDTIKVSARVPEAWAPELAGLEEFTFTVGVSGPVHTAKLYSVQPVVEQASRSFEIVGTAPNDGSIKPGMFANVILESPTAKQTLWLPASAVATSDLPQVLMAEDGAVAYRKVRIGRRDDGLVEIVDGLSVDESVIADVSGLSRGLPVKIVN
ncbi:MAG: efflux RND transporter periplasmic adaptor subunit [Thermoanaerobaculales bacterium]